MPNDSRVEPKNVRGLVSRAHLFPIGLILLVALISRFANLGYQGFHHDESIHCLHSWQIFHQDRGPATYRYSPVYHGPFLYHWGALFQTFLPDTDGAARAPYATVGVFLVAVFLLWGRWLGWGTCLLVSSLLLMSPVVNYFSRFARNDVYQTAWLAGALVFGGLYLHRRKTGYLTAASIFLVLSYCTKENSYVNNFALCSFVVGWGLWRVARGRMEAVREIFVDTLPLVRLLILFGCFSFFVFAYVAIDCRVGYETGLARGLSNILAHSTSVREKADASVFKNEEGYFSGRGQRGGQTEEQKELQRRYLRFAVGFTLLLLLIGEAVSIGLSRRSRRRFLAVDFLARFGIMVVLYLLATYRLTEFWSWMRLSPAEQAKWTPLGLEFLGGLIDGGGKTLQGPSFLRATGLRLFLDFIALSAAGFLLVFPRYWGSTRAPSSQASHSNGVETSVSQSNGVKTSVSQSNGVETSVSFSADETEVSTPIGAIPTNAIRDWVHLLVQILLACWIYSLLFTSLGTHVGRGSKDGLYEYISYWFKHQTGDYRIWGAWWYYVPRLLMYEALPLFLAIAAVVLLGARRLLRFARKRRADRVVAVPVPQSKRKKSAKKQDKPATANQVLKEPAPIGDSPFWKPVPKPLLFFSAYLLVFMLGVYALLNEKVPWLLTYQSFAIDLFAGLWVGHWLAITPHRWTTAFGSWESLRELSGKKGWKRVRRFPILFLKWTISSVVLFLFLFLFVFTLGQHLTTVFFRPDRPSELLVYTGTTHEFAQHMRRISRLIDDGNKEGNEKVRIAIHGKAEWPSAWYFRTDEERPIDVAYKRIDLERDVQLLDDTPQNRRKMKRTGRIVWDTNSCDLRGWWIWHGTPDALPGKLNWRENVAAFLFNRPNDRRRYFPKDQPPQEDYPIGFRTQILRYLFGRHVWYPVGGEKILVCYKTDEMSAGDEAGGYLEGSEKTPRPLAAAFSFGVKGSERGQLNGPRGLAVTPQGNIAVADSKNGRISLFSPEGNFLSSFGEGILSVEYTGAGDVVCDASGAFYVADTWNHRIRKFSSDGTPLESTGEALDGSNRSKLYGPRGIALDRAGRVYVSDTGFGYVRVYDANLKPLFSWGGKGKAPGSFIEPVGIAVDSQDRVYVADTGNGRIQRFDREGLFDAEFKTMELAESESVSGVEPYLEVLPDDLIAVTYSNEASVWILDPEKRSAVLYKIVRPSLGKPIGIAAEGNGYVWIGDKVSGKIAKVKIP